MMKKTYETPVAEKVEFRYQEQVAASASASSCISAWINAGAGHCEGEPTLWERKNA